PGMCAGEGLSPSSGSVAYRPVHESYRFLHAARANGMSPEQAEKTAAEGRIALVEFLRGSDILILDAQYTDTEYESHVGWGHGSVSSAVSLTIDEEVRRRLVLHRGLSPDDPLMKSIVEQS